jgi:hypothetical protein
MTIQSHRQSARGHVKSAPKKLTYEYGPMDDADELARLFLSVLIHDAPITLGDHDGTNAVQMDGTYDIYHACKVVLEHYSADEDRYT